MAEPSLTIPLLRQTVDRAIEGRTVLEVTAVKPLEKGKGVSSTQKFIFKLVTKLLLEHKIFILLRMLTYINLH